MLKSLANWRLHPRQTKHGLTGGKVRPSSPSWATRSRTKKQVHQDRQQTGSSTRRVGRPLSQILLQHALVSKQRTSQELLRPVPPAAKISCRRSSFHDGDLGASPSVPRNYTNFFEYQTHHGQTEHLLPSRRSHRQLA